MSEPVGKARSPAALVFAALLAFTAGTTVVVSASAAEAADVEITCPVGTQLTAYEPGLLLLVTREVEFESHGTLANCVGHPAIVGAQFVATGDGMASCIAGNLPETTIYAWSNGQTSTVVGVASIAVRPNGITVLILIGEVTKGLFKGASATQTKVLPNLALTACLSEPGLTNLSGPVSLTITGGR